MKHDLLDFKRDAYELLCQIGNRSDKKRLSGWGTRYRRMRKTGETLTTPFLSPKRWRKSRKTRNGRPNGAGTPSGITLNPLETGAFEEVHNRCCL